MENNTCALSWATLAAHLLVLLFAPCVMALDMEGAKEQPCFKIENTFPMDLNWVTSVKTWYFPIMSRIILYKSATDLAGRDSKELSEDEMYYDSCITWELGETSFVTHGFNGQEVIYNVKPLGEGLEAFKFSTDGGNSGTSYTILTDNKTFTVSAGCLTENQMFWDVASPLKTLPKETVELIRERVESLGFKREFFTGLRYDYCQGDEEKDEL